MAKKKSAKTIYNGFIEKFMKKSGYIGSLLKNKSGKQVFEFEFKSLKDKEDAKSFLSEMSLNATQNKVNPNKFLVVLD